MNTGAPHNFKWPPTREQLDLLAAEGGVLGGIQFLPSWDVRVLNCNERQLAAHHPDEDPAAEQGDPLRLERPEVTD
jgi:hypothetical protein